MAQQRAERGFAQGAMDEETIARFQAVPGVFVAEETARWPTLR
ncbi:hypothetical protein [Rhodococcus sp. IEGM 1379]|nr:hypothetical protein [Rhodococcus sp. IEGM 1379]MDI9917462.1 hypothetical protein [Rhodococcus sp. IEGM 1379]